MVCTRIYDEIQLTSRLYSAEGAPGVRRTREYLVQFLVLPPPMASFVLWAHVFE